VGQVVVANHEENRCLKLLPPISRPELEIVWPSPISHRRRRKVAAPVIKQTAVVLAVNAVIRFEVDSAVVLIVDNEAAPGTRPMHGSGKGLIGMRERASVYGGTVQAGPTPTGWRVRAVLRWDEHDEGTFSWQTPL